MYDYLNEKKDQIDRVKCEQEFGGLKAKYDPDTSPEAWRHFKNVYTGDDDKSLNNIFDFETLTAYDGGFCATIKNDIAKSNNLSPLLKLRGETDFSFKKGVDGKGYNYFKKCLEERYHEDDKTVQLAKLDYCSQHHHTLENFSLMQVIGGMQLAKGRSLDRLDKIVYRLDEYYKNKSLDNVPSSSRKKSDYRRYLKEYLDYIVEGPTPHIHNYCKKIYLIHDNNLIDDLIESGKHPINSGKRVVEYMDLALRYWQERRNYFKNLI